MSRLLLSGRAPQIRSRMGAGSVGLLLGALLLADPLLTSVEARVRWVPCLPLPALRTWATVFPQEPVGHYALGLQYRRARDRLTASAEFERAVQLFPQFSLARAYLSEAALDRGESDRAYELAQQCLGEDPPVVPALVVMGRLHQEHLEWAQAEQCADTALSNSPGCGEAWALKAGLCAAREDWPGCTGAAMRTVALDPGSAKGWTLLAQGRLGQGDAVQALGAARKAVSLTPHSDEALTFLGEGLLRTGALREAGDTFRAVVAGGRVGSRASLGLAQALRQQGSQREAEREAERALQQWPLENGARMLLAECCAARGQHSRAQHWRMEHGRWERFLRRKAALEPEQSKSRYDPASHFLLARLMVQMGLWHEAMAEGQRGFRKISQPASLHFWTSLQQAYPRRSAAGMRERTLRKLDLALEELGAPVHQVEGNGVDYERR